MTTVATHQDRHAGTDADVRAALGRGDTRAALHVARQALEAAAAKVRRGDPDRGALLTAALAGSLAALAATLATSQPQRPPGYTGGTPAPADLTAAYTAAYDGTLRRDANVR